MRFKPLFSGSERGRRVVAFPVQRLNSLHRFTVPTERTSSRESASDGLPFVTTMLGGGLEMRSLSAVAGRKSTPFHGADGADALQGIGQRWPSVRSNDDRCRLGEGCGPSQPWPAVNQHPFTAPTEWTPSADRPAMGIRSRRRWTSVLEYFSHSTKFFVTLVQ